MLYVTFCAITVFVNYFSALTNYNFRFILNSKLLPSHAVSFDVFVGQWIGSSTAIPELRLY